MHEVLDIERWRRECPLEAHQAYWRERTREWTKSDPNRYPNQQAFEAALARAGGPTFRTVISPIDIAIIEQWREAHGAAARAQSTVPSDVFVWALGEPPDARMTKIGGIPFWPAGSVWPVDDHRDPMQFVAQLCFCDSYDLPLPRLPGDILSVFIALDDENYLRWPYPDAYHFMWSCIDAPNTSDATCFPTFDRPLRSVWGLRHRTCDVDLLQSDGEYVAGREDDQFLERIDGTKIGGLPYWPQGEVEMDGRFLAAIGSVYTYYRNPWPLANVPEIQSSSALDEQLLMIGDVGVINLFINDDCSIGVTADCG